MCIKERMSASDTFPIKSLGIWVLWRVGEKAMLDEEEEFLRSQGVKENLICPTGIWYWVEHPDCSITHEMFETELRGYIEALGRQQCEQDLDEAPGKIEKVARANSGIAADKKHH